VRIEPKLVAAYPWYLRAFFWNQQRKYGRALDAALLWARSPRLFLAVAAIYGLIDRRHSPIEPVLRSLITVRVSQINWCAFCVDLNSATLIKRGVAEDLGLDRDLSSRLNRVTHIQGPVLCRP
jgi:AhpD family alkylhydroperoxidase